MDTIVSSRSNGSWTQGRLISTWTISRPRGSNLPNTGERSAYAVQRALFTICSTSIPRLSGTQAGANLTCPLLIPRMTLRTTNLGLFMSPRMTLKGKEWSRIGHSLGPSLTFSEDDIANFDREQKKPAEDSTSALPAFGLPSVVGKAAVWQGVSSGNAMPGLSPMILGCLVWIIVECLSVLPVAVSGLVDKRPRSRRSQNLRSTGWIMLDLSGSHQDSESTVSSTTVSLNTEFFLKQIVFSLELWSCNFCDLTLDPNTAYRKLKLSDNNKKVTRMREEQEYPDHQDRFDRWPQLLCVSDLTGRCYWEVQWSGGVFISVSYRRIGRKGDSYDSAFGYNDQSWSLDCSKDGFSVWHKRKRTPLSEPRSSSGTIGVLVDCPAGSLSFYTVSSDRLTHLHTFNTTFTQPLVPGFWLWYDSSVSLCASTHSL
ncbi:hypothetical protein WMY93_006834 [Mugilogobius chulae]|uniref:B30.2/SPRY domain-containing protein n=1 Tax=Mugilogobius chulae TaxID=88201 RepID=A0AAW0PV48_9GOBI